jgi:uncharacterized protein (DUF2141 family)
MVTLIKKLAFNISWLVICFIFSSSCPIPKTGIKVSIPNLHNNKGHVLISLFKEGVGFPDDPEKAFRKVKISISNKVASTIFTDLPSGNYAIAILHDENGDQKMNTNFFGYPKEGYGFSNNVTGLLGPPSFDKASFSYTANGTVVLSIRVRY